MKLRELMDKFEKAMVATAFAEAGEWEMAANQMGRSLKRSVKRPAKQALRKGDSARPRLTL